MGTFTYSKTEKILRPCPACARMRDLLERARPMVAHRAIVLNSDIAEHLLAEIDLEAADQIISGLRMLLKKADDSIAELEAEVERLRSASDIDMNRADAAIKAEGNAAYNHGYDDGYNAGRSRLP